jgi:hypothetical protein
MGGTDRLIGLTASRRVNAVEVAQDREDPRLIEDHPMLDAIAQVIDHHRSIVAEVLG